jgi:hypothetical protein
MIHLRGSEAEV